MIHRVFLIMLFLVIVVVTGCKYKKGDMYTSRLSGDSINYVIMAKGSGKNISIKASKQKLQHEYKGNSCRIKYFSDSATLNNQKGILLFNSTLPDIKNDMLTKGFFGTFTSKQNVSFILVSNQDFEQYFRKKEL
jgi:hypothetical protein